jgi:hypothetical protein
MQEITSPLFFSKKFKYKNIVIKTFFILYLLIGILIFRDFGIACDENFARTQGGVNVKYIGEKFFPFLLDGETKNFQGLMDKDFGDKNHGAAFEIPLYIIEKLILSDSPSQNKIIKKIQKTTRSQYMLRHLLTFLFWFFGCYAFFDLMTRRYKDWRIGLLSTSLLILSPRFFAEAFYNHKDIIFMSSVIFALNSIFRLLRELSNKSIFLSALAIAYSIDVRIMGIILVPFSYLVIGFHYIKNKITFKNFFFICFSFSVILVSLVILMWPTLWSDPFGNFVSSFKSMSVFPWGGDVMYFGRLIKATELPWHYVFVWILITTPILYLLFFTVGFLEKSYKIFKFNLDKEYIETFIVICTFLLPIFSVIYLHSVLYDGWRHLYFIYPSFLILAVDGFFFLFKKTFFRSIVFTFLIFSLTYQLFWIIENHPFQNVYFNKFAGDNVYRRFEVDYWGLENRKALEYILDNDSSSNITVGILSSTPLPNSFQMLKDRSRIQFTQDNINAKYLVNNYKSVHDLDSKPIGYQIFYNLIVDDQLVLTIFKKNK